MRTEIGVRNLMYQSFTTQTFKSLRKHKSFYFSFYTIDTDDDISANPDFTSPFEGKENQKQVLFIGKTQRRIHIKPGKDIRYYKLLNNPIVIPYSKEIENKIIQSLK